MNSIKRKYASLPLPLKASIWFLICSFLQKGISTVTTPIFTRLMSVSEYGEYSVFNSWLSIVTIFVSLQLTSGVYTQGLVKFDKERSVFASSLQGLTLTLVFFWTIIYLLFIDFWNALFSLTTVQMLAMLIMIWSTSVFGFWAAEQRVEYRYRKLVLVTLIVSLAKPIIGILFVVLAEDKVTARILGLMLVELVCYTGLFFVQLKRGKVFFSWKFWKYAILFNLPLIPHYLSQNILNSADRIMIKSIIGEDAAGIYSLAYSISLIMTLFNTALSQTISPWMYKKIKDRELQDIKGIAYISLLTVAFLNLLLIALAPEVVSIFAPREYHDAIYVIPPVAMSVFFIFMYDFFSRFEFYYEKTGFLMFASILGAVLNVVLNAVFIPVFGYQAAGYTTLCCYLIYVICHYYCMRKICRDYFDNEKVYDVGTLLCISALMIGGGFILMSTYENPLIRYTILICTVLLAFIKRRTIISNLKHMMEIRK